MKPDSERDMELPEALRDALSNYSNQQVLVPPQRDDQVLRLAREQLKVQQIAARRARWGWWSAAAVLVALLVWSFWTTAKPRYRTHPALMTQRSGDIDGNGVVDIFDAFALARNVEKRPSPTAWDINGDGIVDGRDISAIAQRAVQLQGHTL